MVYIKSILSGIAIVAVAVIFITLRSGCKAIKEVHTVSNIGKIEQYDSTGHYRDLYKTEHATRLLEQGDKKVLVAFHRRQMDSLCKRYDIRIKQLQSSTTAQASASGTGSTQAQPVYTVTPAGEQVKVRDTFNWSDAWTAISGSIDAVGKVKISYSVEMPMSVSTYWKRKWFLGRKRYYLDAYSDNQHIHIYGLSGYKVN